MLRLLWLSVIIVVFGAALCSTVANIKVFEFNPNFPDNNYITIQPKLLLKNSTGFSLCLRAIIWKWDYKEIFQSKNLDIIVRNFEQPYGYLYLESNFYPFVWKNTTQVSSMTWNSVCMLVHESNYLNIIINGDYVANHTIHKSLQFLNNFTDTIYLGESSESKSFSGQLTDLNLWSRPISSDEVKQYSLGCDHDLLSRSEPDYVFWPEANITYQGNRTKSSNLPFQDICQKYNRIDLSVIQYPDYDSFEFANNSCKLLNGNIPTPKSKNHFEEMLSFIGDLQINSKCNGTYWIPINGSFDVDLKWLNESFSSDALNLANRMYIMESGNRSPNKDICLYADAKSKTLNSTLCTRLFDIISFPISK